MVALLVGKRNGWMVARMVEREWDGWILALLVGRELNGRMVALLVGKRDDLMVELLVREGRLDVCAAGWGKWNGWMVALLVGR